MKLKFLILCVTCLGWNQPIFDSIMDRFSQASNKNQNSLLEKTYKKDLFGGYAFINSLYKNNSQIGHVLWISRYQQKINAKYFATSEAYSDYFSWKSNKKIYLACSGAYTNGGKPVGFTVDNGKIINKHVSEMDGLVIVYATGGVVVSDIDKGDLHLKSLGRKLNLRTNSQDRIDLLNWAVKEKATIFQTHLLAYKDQLRLNVSRARTERAERRILVLAKIQGILFHIVYNINSSVYLGDISSDIFSLLKSYNAEVIGMLNFDTGSYDIIEVFDQWGQQDNNIKGSTSISSATNLLIYHYTE